MNNLRFCGLQTCCSVYRMHEQLNGVINAEVNLLKLTVLTEVPLKKNNPSLNRFQTSSYNIDCTDVIFFGAPL